MKKLKGDAHIFLVGMLMIFLIFVITLLSIRLQLLHYAFDELDASLTSAELSSALVSREDSRLAMQLVVHSLEDFDGTLTNASNYSQPDEYLDQAYDVFEMVLTENYNMTDEGTPAATLITTKAEIINYDVYNKYLGAELILDEAATLAAGGTIPVAGEPYDEEAEKLRIYETEYTGDFRIYRHRYDAASGSWKNVTVYGINETPTVYDSLIQQNVEVENTTIVAQIKVTVEILPRIASFIGQSAYDALGLTQTYYYQRVVDITSN